MDDGRYSRQERFAPIGAAGQARIRAATVAIVGCGALGAAAADLLARAGVGRLRLIDRDIVEASNLQRQGLYDEADAAAGRPKALAAARRIAAINGGVVVEPVVGELTAANACDLLAGCAVVCDGADNFPTRHLVNEASRRLGIPWVWAACVGAYALSAPFPVDGPCLGCLQDVVPDPGQSPTCDSAGIIGPAVQLAAAWQVAETLKLLVGDTAAVRRELWACDLWSGRFQRIGLGGRDPACRVCGAGADFPALAAEPEPAVVLCGRDLIQVRYAPIDLSALAQRLGRPEPEGVVRWRDGGHGFTAFADGRVLVHGATDPGRARAAADRWLG
jgi:molybdopterin/thiamine biosynthesis adenylyltransferase